MYKRKGVLKEECIQGKMYKREGVQQEERINRRVYATKGVYKKKRRGALAVVLRAAAVVLVVPGASNAQTQAHQYGVRGPIKGKEETCQKKTGLPISSV